MSIHSVLTKVVPPAGFTANNSASPLEQVAAARDRLRDAILDGDIAPSGIADAEAALERIGQLIAAADDADVELQTAEANSAAFTQAWAESGARPDRPQTDPKLCAEADAASRKATAARIAADGARAALPVANAALDDARRAVEDAKTNIVSADMEVLLALVESNFAIIAKSMAGINGPIHDIEALALVLDYNLGPFSGAGEAGKLLNRLEALLPAPVRHRDALRRAHDLESRANEWRELMHKLKTDADAG